MPQGHRRVTRTKSSASQCYFSLPLPKGTVLDAIQSGMTREHISVFGTTLETRIITVFIQKEMPNPWLRIGFFHYSLARGNLTPERFKKNFFSGQSGEIYTCARRGFAFSWHRGSAQHCCSATICFLSRLPISRMVTVIQLELAIYAVSSLRLVITCSDLLVSIFVNADLYSRTPGNRSVYS